MSEISHSSQHTYHNGYEDIITEIRQASCPQTSVTSFTFYIHLNEDEEKSEASIDNLANIRIVHKRI